MTRNANEMHYCIVENSPDRLQKVVDLLKSADHPLSAMEITIQAFVPNASTNIGEIRKNDGIRPGTRRHIISPATKWKGRRYPWHDGKDRYWLIEAPEWEARWTVNANGDIIPANARGHFTMPQQEQHQPADPDAPIRCKYCGLEIVRTAEDPLKIFCGEACREGFKGTIFSNKPGRLPL